MHLVALYFINLCAFELRSQLHVQRDNMWMLKHFQQSMLTKKFSLNRMLVTYRTCSPRYTLRKCHRNSICIPLRRFRRLLLHPRGVECCELLMTVSAYCLCTHKNGSKDRTYTSANMLAVVQCQIATSYKLRVQQLQLSRLFDTACVACGAGST